MQEEILQYEKIDHIFQHIEQEDMIDIWNHSEVLYGAKDTIRHLLEYINILLLDKLKESNDLRYANCINVIEQTKKRLSTNANYDMCIDHLLLKIWEEFHEEYRWN